MTRQANLHMAHVLSKTACVSGGGGRVGVPMSKPTRIANVLSKTACVSGGGCRVNIRRADLIKSNIISKMTCATEADFYLAGHIQHIS